MNTDFLAPQIAYVPRVVGEPLVASNYLAGGMGGSALPAFVARYLGVTNLTVRRDYAIAEEGMPDTAAIALSYSGNTEETLSFFTAAGERGLARGVVTSGGALLDAAIHAGVPYVVVPGDMQPRDALLAMTKAFLTLINEAPRAVTLDATHDALDQASSAAADVADFLEGNIPVVYASTDNEVLAYISKITYNETAKSPAFSNVFPELNHNEMQGLDPLGSTGPLSDTLAVVILADPTDRPHITRRQEVFAALMQEKGLKVRIERLPNRDRAYRLVYTWMLARKVAHTLAERYGVPADEVPLVEEFKRRLAS